MLFRGPGAAAALEHPVVGLVGRDVELLLFVHGAVPFAHEGDVEERAVVLQQQVGRKT